MSTNFLGVDYFTAKRLCPRAQGCLNPGENGELVSTPKGLRPPGPTVVHGTRSITWANRCTWEPTIAHVGQPAHVGPNRSRGQPAHRGPATAPTGARRSKSITWAIGAHGNHDRSYGPTVAHRTTIDHMGQPARRSKSITWPTGAHGNHESITWANRRIGPQSITWAHDQMRSFCDAGRNPFGVGIIGTFLPRVGATLGFGA
jgi:hypothetical protein